MHKKVVAGKKTDARIGLQRATAGTPASSTPRRREARPAFRQIPRSVNELLTRGKSLGALSRAIPAQQSWTAWLCEHLSAELAAHVVSVVPKAGVPRTGGPRQPPTELVVLADSAAWCARLRYALGELHATLLGRDPSLSRVSVRVRPREARS